MHFSPRPPHETTAVGGVPLPQNVFVGFVKISRVTPVVAVSPDPGSPAVSHHVEFSGPTTTVHHQMVGFSRVSMVSAVSRVTVRVSIKIRVSFSKANLQEPPTSRLLAPPPPGDECRFLGDRAKFI